MDIEQTIAFGDGRNDVEMLTEVGLGIAMGNGAIEAKAVADYVTDDIDKDGILKALNHFSLIKWFLSVNGWNCNVNLLE